MSRAKTLQRIETEIDDVEDRIAQLEQALEEQTEILAALTEKRNQHGGRILRCVTDGCNRSHYVHPGHNPPRKWWVFSEPDCGICDYLCPVCAQREGFRALRLGDYIPCR